MTSKAKNASPEVDSFTKAAEIVEKMKLPPAFSAIKPQNMKIVLEAPKKKETSLKSSSQDQK